MYIFRDSLPQMSGMIRFLHAVPDAPNVDIYADGKLLYSNLSFGSVSNYLTILPKTYNVQLYKAGTRENTLISESVEILPNSVTTLAVTYENNEIAFFTLDDTLKNVNPLLSYVRLINLSPNSPSISLSVPESNLVFFNQTPYLETNEYYPTSPGIYNFIISASDGKFDKYISDVNLTQNLFVTIYIIGLYNGTPRIGYVLTRDGMNKQRLKEI